MKPNLFWSMKYYFFLLVLFTAVVIKYISLVSQFSTFMPDPLVRRVLYTIPFTRGQLEKEAHALISQQPGNYAFYVKLLSPPFTSQPVNLWGNAQFPGASLAKLYIVAAAFNAIEQGKFSLSQVIEITQQQQTKANYGTGLIRFRLGFVEPFGKQYRKPSDIYGDQPNGSAKLTLGELLYLSIRYSDNIAIVAIADLVGRDTIQNYVVGLGLTGTSILTTDATGNTVRPNLTTARDCGVFLEKLYEKRIIPKHAQLFLSWLETTDETDRLVYPLPPHVRMLHKTAESSEEGIYHDAGIIITPQGTAAVVVTLSQQPVGTTGEFTAAQISTLRALSRLVFNHFLANEHIFYIPHLPGIRYLLQRFNL